MRFLQIRSACGWMFDCCCGHFGSQRGGVMPQAEDVILEMAKDIMNL